MERHDVRPYDPQLDPRCTVVPQPAPEPWPAQWIWYPGQLTAHLHAHAVQRAVARCSYVSYPGTFHQPVHQLHLRTTATLTHPQTLRWRVPEARTRVFVNGRAFDFTRRSVEVAAGPLDLRFVIDFCATLPCLLLDAPDVHTDTDWEVSLDGATWVAAETQHGRNRADRLPDAPHEVHYQIPVAARLGGAVAETYALAAGETLVVDFFHLELGQVQWLVQGATALTVHVGESAAEVIDTTSATMEQLPLPVYHCGGSAEIVLPERCVRFLRITTSQACVIAGLCFVARVTPLPYVGAFACSDPQLTAIWAAGAATLHACTHDFVLDGLRRDGLPWADQLSEVEGADCVFFDTAAARQSLVALTFPVPAQPSDLGIIDQPFLLPLSLWHDWVQRGDVSFVAQQIDVIRSLLDMYHALQDEHGLISAARVYAAAPLRDSNWNFFPDWAIDPAHGPDTRGTPAYAHMLLLQCYTVAAELEHVVGNRTRVQHYRAQADRLRTTLRRLFWDDARGVFVNGYDQAGALDTRVTVYAQVWGILTDLIPSSAYEHVYATVIENPDCRSATISLNHHWEYAAAIKARRIPQALTVLRRAWGGWLAAGHTRFPEDLRPHAGERDQLSMYGRPHANSLCHGWAGGAAVMLLSRGVLGITATALGFGTCRIAPQLGELAWVEGTMPTPHGPIRLQWDGKTGTLELPAIDATLDGCQTEAGATVVTGPGTFGLCAKP